MLGTDGRVDPIASAMIRLTGPATPPLTAASQAASLSATMRVRLLSRPQHRHAPSTASDGTISPRSAPVGMLSRMAPATIAMRPSATRRSTFSRNTNQASTAVKTASALSSSEAPEAGMLARPESNSSGAITPPKSTAPARGANSCRCSRTRGARRMSRYKPSPMPEPV